MNEPTHTLDANTKIKLRDLLKSAHQHLSLEDLSNSELIKVCNEFRVLSVGFERALSKHMTGGDCFSVDGRKGLQNKQFMIDLLPRIQSWLNNFPIDSEFSVLDVGPSWGLGTNLLANLYKRPYLGYKLDVTALDITDYHLPYIRAFCPYVRHDVIDLFDIEQQYDIVICSHVIEHVEKPLDFVRQLINTAKRMVFLAAPYNEKEPRASEHINTIDDNFLSELNAEKIEIIKSAGWGARSNIDQKMFIAQIPIRN